MSTPQRLLGFAAVLAAVFGLSLFGARTVLPADLARGASTTSSHDAAHQTGEEETDMDHEEEPDMDHAASTGPSEKTEPSEQSHGGGHGPSPSADPVRGLAVAQNGYQLETLTAPEKTGEDGVLSFRLTGPDGHPVTDYTTSHDKELHLIVVRTDGTQFRHVHPTMDADGTWSLPWQWAEAGTYRVFADFVPTATGEPADPDQHRRGGRHPHPGLAAARTPTPPSSTGSP